MSRMLSFLERFLMANVAEERDAKTVIEPGAHHKPPSRTVVPEPFTSGTEGSIGAAGCRRVGPVPPAVPVDEPAFGAECRTAGMRPRSKRGKARGCLTQVGWYGWWRAFSIVHVLSGFLCRIHRIAHGSLRVPYPPDIHAMAAFEIYPGLKTPSSAVK